MELIFCQINFTLGGQRLETNEILFYKRKVTSEVIVFGLIKQIQNQEDVAEIPAGFCDVGCDFLYF